MKAIYLFNRTAGKYDDAQTVVAQVNNIGNLRGLAIAGLRQGSMLYQPAARFVLGRSSKPIKNIKSVLTRLAKDVPAARLEEFTKLCDKTPEDQRLYFKASKKHWGMDYKEDWICLISEDPAILLTDNDPQIQHLGQLMRGVTPAKNSVEVTLGKKKWLTGEYYTAQKDLYAMQKSLDVIKLIKGSLAEAKRSDHPYIAAWVELIEKNKL